MGLLPVNGPVTGAIQNISPPEINPQVYQMFNNFIQASEESVGCTQAVLGTAPSYNSSAIIASQRSAQTPNEITKQAIYKTVEDLYRVFLELIANLYGKRSVNAAPTQDVLSMYQAAGLPIPEAIPQEFDFGYFKKHPTFVKLDVGSSSYYSEITAVETLSNLLMQGKITILQFLERIPSGTIADRDGLIAELKRQQSAMGMNVGGMGMPTPESVNMGQQITGGDATRGKLNPMETANPDTAKAVGGKGNHDLSRQLNAAADRSAQAR